MRTHVVATITIGSALQPPAVECEPLAHANLPEPGTDGFVLLRMPVVRHVDHELTWRPAEFDAGARRAGVLDRVGQRFLYDAERCEVDAGSKRMRLALNGDSHRQTGVGDVGDQL